MDDDILTAACKVAGYEINVAELDFALVMETQAVVKLIEAASNWSAAQFMRKHLRSAVVTLEAMAAEPLSNEAEKQLAYWLSDAKSILSRGVHSNERMEMEVERACVLLANIRPKVNLVSKIVPVTPPPTPSGIDPAAQS